MSAVLGDTGTNVVAIPMREEGEPVIAKLNRLRVERWRNDRINIAARIRDVTRELNGLCKEFDKVEAAIAFAESRKAVPYGRV